MKLIASRLNDKEFMKSLLIRHNVPGVSYRFICEGEPQETQTAGVRNISTGEPVTPDTMFEAASLTKTLFASLAMRLVDRGVFSLDEEIAQRVPGLRISEDERIGRITPRQILSHGTGLPNWADKPLQFLFDPGDDFSYSGEGYYYLHKIVDALSGKEFAQHFRDEFFAPLKMENSRAVWDPSVPDKMSNKFDREGKMLPLRSWIDSEGNAPEPNSAWSLYSGAEDYTKFLLEILNDKGHMSESSFREMTSPQNEAGDGIFWGLGWGLTSKDKSVLWHWGDNGGYRSFAVVDIDTREGACIFCNGEGGTDLCMEYLKYVTDGVFWDDVAAFIETAE